MTPILPTKTTNAASVAIARGLSPSPIPLGSRELALCVLDAVMDPALGPDRLVVADDLLMHDLPGTRA